MRRRIPGVVVVLITLTLLGLLVVAYLAITTLLFFVQARLVYYPQIGRESNATPAQAGLAYEALKIVAADKTALDAWFVPAPEPRGVLLFLHGNAGSIAHRIDYLALFSGLGLSTLIFDYRGYGKSEGTPSERGTYRDAEAAWRYLIDERGIPPGEVVLFGESLGGAVASWLAAHKGPAGLIIVSAFTSVPNLAAQLYPWLPVRLISRFRYNTLASLTLATCPVLVAHSTDDEIVPFEHGRQLYEAARPPKQFLEMCGGHNDILARNHATFESALRAFLDESLEKSQKSGAGTRGRPA